MTASIALHEGFVPPAEPVAESAAMREALAAAADVAETPTTVLLLGESGTGKEVLARTWRARTSQGDRV